MSEQITWTHVDKLVRKMHDERGMLQSGMNDAEVTYTMIKFLDRQTRTFSQSNEELEARCGALEVQLMRAKEAQVLPKGKTKQRLAILEERVGQLMQWADRE
jgi:hypothetical protein